MSSHRNLLRTIGPYASIMHATAAVDALQIEFYELRHEGAPSTLVSVNVYDAPKYHTDATYFGDIACNMAFRNDKIIVRFAYDYFGLDDTDLSALDEDDRDAEYCTRQCVLYTYIATKLNLSNENGDIFVFLEKWWIDTPNGTYCEMRPNN